MDRNDYILLCQKVSVLDDKERKEEFVVLFNGIEYFPYYYSMTFDKKGNALNIAVLQDKKANSTTACLIEQIERKYKND